MKTGIINDMINSLDIDELIEMKKNQKYLDMHKYSIWQSKDGKYWYTNLPDSTKERGVRQVRRNSRKELDNTIIEFYQELETKITIDKLFHEWNDSKLELNKISDLTHLRNEQVYKKHCLPIADKLIEDITVNDFADFLEYNVAEFHLTSKAFSNLKTIIRGIIKLARKKSLISYTDYDVMCCIDISDRAFKKTTKDDDEEVFDNKEMSMIIKYCNDDQDVRNLGIMLLFVSGMRVGELVALKKCDIIDNLVRVRRTEIRVPNPDGGSIYEVRDFPKSQAGVRDIVIPNEYQWLLDKLVRRVRVIDDFIFTDSGKRLTTNTIRKRLSFICDKLGVKHKSPHKIRKTYGTILLDNNLDERFVIEQMGHVDVKITEEHYHRNRRKNKEKSEIISAIPDFKA